MTPQRKRMRRRRPRARNERGIGRKSRKVKFGGRLPGLDQVMKRLHYRLMFTGMVRLGFLSRMPGIDIPGRAG